MTRTLKGGVAPQRNLARGRDPLGHPHFQPPALQRYHPRSSTTYRSPTTDRLTRGDSGLTPSTPLFLFQVGTLPTVVFWPYTVKPKAENKPN